MTRSFLVALSSSLTRSDSITGIGSLEIEVASWYSPAQISFRPLGTIHNDDSLLLPGTLKVVDSFLGRYSSFRLVRLLAVLSSNLARSGFSVPY
jgi:hypothetical protein